MIQSEPFPSETIDSETSNSRRSTSDTFISETLKIESPASEMIFMSDLEMTDLETIDSRKSVFRTPAPGTSASETRFPSEMAPSGTLASIMPVFETVKLEPYETADSETIYSELPIYDTPGSEMLVFETIKLEPPASETSDSETADSKTVYSGRSVSGTPDPGTSASEIRASEIWSRNGKPHLSKNLMEALDAISHGMSLRKAEQIHYIQIDFTSIKQRAYTRIYAEDPPDEKEKTRTETFDGGLRCHHPWDDSDESCGDIFYIQINFTILQQRSPRFNKEEGSMYSS
ncbi:PREDICTED: uncharacterized protein LOC106744502 isoform X1 [Dinoponera quadriceps]|uniref:Uncharacterized protein LOC106744502 isoform X1 n=1 Tax=Dinoponera quadriceps TaxID=609295 RepID=A0A6P3X935_DINQU|nr:PREDICTED: uncharacterized protein LOC106744502 isoform X1 [Dinoponera quadriceps]